MSVLKEAATRLFRRGDRDLPGTIHTYDRSPVTLWRCRFLGGPLAGQTFETKWLGRWLKIPGEDKAYEFLDAVESKNVGETHVLYRWPA